MTAKGSYIELMNRLFFTSKGCCSRFLILLLVSLLWSACSPVRHLNESQYLLEQNKITGNNTEIPNNTLLSVVKQKPNRKILGIYRFHLQMYNLGDAEKYEDRYIKRVEKRRELNSKRLAAGKKQKKEYPFSLARWCMNIGEAPIIADTFELKRSAKQIELYLKNHGYFDAQVKDSIKWNPKTKRATSYYHVVGGNPYRYKKIDYIIEDVVLLNIFLRNMASSKIKKGERFNSDLLDSERDRIQALYRNEGYFGFVKNYINYTADTSCKDYSVDLQLNIENPRRRLAGFADSTIESRHMRYRINNIFITSDYSMRDDTSSTGDTLYFNRFQFITTKGLLKFHPKAIKPSLLLQHGDLYSKTNADLTYSRIAELNAFKFINVSFSPAGADSLGELDMQIKLSPRPRHSITYQTQGTNTAGNFGIAGDIIYQNRNLLRGLELFEFRLTGGLEVQRILGDLGEDNVEGVQTFIPFNTILLGPQVSVSIPKIPKAAYFLGKNNRKTKIAGFFNYQRRPDYERSIFTAIYGFSAAPAKRVIYTFNPAEINYVTVNLSNEFENLLKSSNNLFLKNSFKSQFISAGKFSRTFNTQAIGLAKSFTFFQYNVESAGAFLNLSRNFFKAPAEVDGKYVVFGVPYSQYVRFDSDFRHFRYFKKSTSLGFRAITGLGLPYGNSSVMPFEKSFFVGGANSIRSWIARSLGPGGYSDSTGLRIDQIGDIKVEWNLEYRQKIYGMFELAWFVDAGNVWLRKEDPQRPLAHFEWNRFYKEIAVGGGMGLRLNFDYFIIRLDAAHPLREPAYQPSDRWSFNRMETKKINFNFGIGYPF